ncbi:MAG: type II toxin-antitoxin system YafQ family toxin [Defluviitaleaceae bacterium]|nr:type II toxin-antitoxin system YafQ family toxin [Defluviitaleaceae bacterium]
MNNNPRYVIHTAQFRKGLRKSAKQGKNLKLLEWVVTNLANDEPLPAKCRDHALKGEWKGYRECHVTPDWLLVYKKEDDGELVLVLVRLASHSDLDF